jgi:hypothetical protein
MDTSLSLEASRQSSSVAVPNIEERFNELAENMFQRCRRQQTQSGGATIAAMTDEDDGEEFDRPSYPIAEQQQKRKLEQQLSAGGASA